MKKIALNYIYLSKSHAGGKDQVGINLLKGFEKNGYSNKLVVFCYDYSRELIKSIAPSVEIISIPYGRNTGSELNKMIKNLITNTFVIPKIVKENSISTIFHLNCNNGLAKMPIRSIVLPHDIKAIAHRNLPGLKIPFYKYILYKIMYRMDFMHADNIVAISDTDRSEIVQYYPEYEKKVVRIYNPIDVDFYADSETVKTQNIVAINLQFVHKNIITLVKAFELVSDKVEGDLLLVGDIPKRVEYIKDYIIDHGLSDRIKIMGFLPEDERNRILKSSRLYVNPTLFEGFGMTAIEAMIVGTPTLVSKIDTNFEVTKGLCNYYFPPEDENALAEELIKCLSTKISKKRQKDISNMICAEYDYRVISEKYWELLYRE